jgi:uncharacterized glyoxalase superfamily protein PhnB
MTSDCTVIFYFGGSDMDNNIKIGAQVYVNDSIEAVDMYCRAFGAKPSFEIKDESGAYEHCELSVNGQFFMCVSEKGLFDESVSEQSSLTMAFNVPGLGSEQAVRKVHDILGEGGKVLHLGARPWSAFCADIVDKFGVFWWIAV